MKKTHLGATLGLAVMMASCTMFKDQRQTRTETASNEANVQTENKNKEAHDKAASMTSGWPESSINAAKEMVSKYGEPTERTSDTLVWRNIAPFKKIFSLLLLAISFTVKGQAKFMPEKIFTKNILFKEGLSQCVITDIVQDKKGFVWAATYDGLNRFDGQNIKVFRHNPDDDNSISSSRIQKLDADEQNHLYMLTNKGFRIFDCSLEKTIRPKTLSTINPAWFCNESKNTIWLYDLQKGLFLVDNSRFHIIQSFPHLGNKLSESIIDIYGQGTLKSIQTEKLIIKIKESK
jgi:hypothetical protein